MTAEARVCLLFIFALAVHLVVPVIDLELCTAVSCVCVLCLYWLWFSARLFVVQTCFVCHVQYTCVRAYIYGTHSYKYVAHTCVRAKCLHAFPLTKFVVHASVCVC